MTKDGCTGSMFTCVQAIKNLMKNYNSRGEWVEPTWEYGKAIPSGVVDGITRESVESQLVKSGNTFVQRSSVSGSTIDLQI